MESQYYSNHSIKGETRYGDIASLGFWAAYPCSYPGNKRVHRRAERTKLTLMRTMMSWTFWSWCIRLSAVVLTLVTA